MDDEYTIKKDWYRIYQQHMIDTGLWDNQKGKDFMYNKCFSNLLKKELLPNLISEVQKAEARGDSSHEFQHFIDAKDMRNYSGDYLDIIYILVNCGYKVELNQTIKDKLYCLTIKW